MAADLGDDRPSLAYRWLKPGEQFEYTSWAQIATAQGSMQGMLIGITEDAEWFESPVTEFALVDSAALH